MTKRNDATVQSKQSKVVHVFYFHYAKYKEEKQSWELLKTLLDYKNSGKGDECIVVNIF